MEIRDKNVIDFKNLPERFKWSDLEKDFVAFSSALLYWKTGLDRDTVSEFIANFVTEKDEYPQICFAPNPVFNIEDPVREMVVTTKMGEKRVTWDLSRMLYFCPKHIWERKENGLRDWLSQVAFVYRADKSYAVSMRCPDMQIMDQMAFANGDFDPGLITVSTFGVYTTDKCAVWRYDTSNPYKKPEAFVTPACDLVIKDGMMFWKENE